jgi:hypothetical protein
MRTAAAQQAEFALIVAEQHQVFAEQAHRHNRPLRRQFFGQRRRLPVLAQELAARRSRPGPGDTFVLLRAHHGGNSRPTLFTE